MEFINGFIKKVIPDNLAGIVGIVQSLIGPIREIAIEVVRILAILVPKKVSEDWIVRVRKVFDVIEGAFEWVKDRFLKAGEE